MTAFLNGQLHRQPLRMWHLQQLGKAERKRAISVWNGSSIPAKSSALSAALWLERGLIVSASWEGLDGQSSDAPESGLESLKPLPEPIKEKSQKRHCFTRIECACLGANRISPDPLPTDMNATSIAECRGKIQAPTLCTLVK